MMTLKQVLAGCAMLSLTAAPYVLPAQQPFKIEGQMGKDQKGMLKYRYTSMKKDVSDSVKVTDGSFRINGVVDEPTAGTFIFLPDDTAIKGQYKEIFIDPAATITMKGEGDLLSLQVKGGPSQNDLEELLAAYKPLTEKGPGLEKQLREYQEAGDEENMNRVGQELQQLRVRRREIQADFAKTHLNSFVGFGLWTRQVPDFVKDPFAVEAELNRYSPAIRNSPTGKELTARLTAAKRLAVGTMAPDFALNDETGKQVSLSSFKGKNVLLFFWNRNFIPFEPFSFAINKVSHQCKDDNLVIVSVFCDTDVTRWRTELEENGLRGNNIVNLIHPVKLTAEPDNTKTGQAYNLTLGVMPHNYLVGADGRILVRDVNIMADPVAEVKQTINK